MTDQQGNTILSEDRTWRWATFGAELWEPVSLPAGTFTLLEPPRKAALLHLVPPKTATSWTLKGVASETGISLIGAQNWGIPIVLSLGTSPSIGILNEGPTCVAQALWVTSATQPEGISDTFTRADSSSLGTTETGSEAWLVTAGMTWGIRSNRAAFLGGAGNTVAVVDAPWSDLDMSVAFPVAASQPVIDGLCFRCSSNETGDGWFVAPNDFPPAGTWRLYTFASGTPTEVANTGVTPADGDVVNVRAVGPSIILKVNGIVRATLSNSWQQAGTRTKSQPSMAREMACQIQCVA